MDVVVILVVGTAVLYVTRYQSLRRVARRNGNIVWVAFAPAVLLGLGLVWLSVKLFAAVPLLGGLLGIAAVLYLAVLFRHLAGVSHRHTSAMPPDRG
jgi:amino acid transporter